MEIWSAEVKELEKLNKTLNENLPFIGKELEPLLKTNDANVVLLYSRRCLEVIVIELCETELKRPRKNEPLMGIIDKLNRDEKVPSHIINAMQSLNSLATYGTHPKDFNPEQVKSALINLSVVIKWYLKFKVTHKSKKPNDEEEPSKSTKTIDSIRVLCKPKKKLLIFSGFLLVSIIIVVAIVVYQQANAYTDIEKTIAVLPFINDSPDKDNEYFINGTMEAILDKLCKIKNLTVIARTSVEQYRENPKPIREMAKEMHVNFILEGSGQKYGNKVRLTLQLIDARTEKHLWSKPYIREIVIDDIFALQSEIAQMVATEIKAIITPEEKKLIEKIPTADITAYEFYLKGQFYWRKLTQNDIETALKYFELAKEKDPDFALAYAGISDVWIALQQMGYASPDEAGPKAKTAVMKALELDSTLAQVHYSLALVRYASEWDWESGESEFQKALAINPNYAEARAYYSHLLNIVGRSKEAMEQIDLALKLDPYNPLLIALYGVDLLFVRRFDEAISVSNKALKMDPTMGLAYGTLISAFYSTGRLEKCLELRKAFNNDPNTGMNHAFDQGYKKAGIVGAYSFEADALAEQSKTSFVLSTSVAFIYILANNKELAIKWLKTAYEVRDPNLNYLLLPIYDSLRSDPRFQEIARKCNLPYKPLE